MATIIPLNRSEGAELLREIATELDNGKATDFVVMARFEDGRTVRKWFGTESSFKCLGMLSYMVHMMCNYIKGEE